MENSKNAKNGKNKSGDGKGCQSGKNAENDD